ncbi:hypothetical protein ACM46_05415 [Chryseobacterium angstadtii]|uniref:Lipoprotein n=1 Tax=Chryseobacterium angstadtii TaxID=558151 RepID=A0A0J7IH75_9FLAO|nr:hypothetical protein [Chryseobacterium angstadtii]KMQ65346.1 hypothetical protein ACM46_05415 [Chryseobacterium angstadtii]
MKKLLLSFVLVIVALSSCSRTIVDPPEDKLTNAVDVYVAGKENNQVCYWKNTVKTNLVNGNNLEPISVYAENNDIYFLARSPYNPANPQNYDYYFWKNNSRQEVKQYLNIPASSYFSFQQFQVKNGDVYITGVIENLNPPTPMDKYEVCYWKNGVKTIVFKHNVQSIEVNLSIINSDFYMISHKYNTATAKFEHGYYKNSTYTSLTSQSSSFVGNGIFADSNDALLFYSDGASNSNNLKNLSNNALTTVPFEYRTFTLDQVSNAKYFVASTKYCKNTINNMTDFSNDPGNFKFITDIKFLNDNSYMIRQRDNNQGVAQKVFINGVESQSMADPNGKFVSLFVIEN